MTYRPRTLEEVAAKLAAERAALREARDVPYPEPEHTSRDPWPVDFVAPRPSVSLRLLAETHGWHVTMTYARGRLPHATTGQPGALRHSVAVRMAHPDTGMCAWATTTSPVEATNWTWLSIVAWGPDLAVYPYMSITDLREWVKARGQVPGYWYTAIRRRLADRAAHRAARPAGSARRRGVMS